MDIMASKPSQFTPVVLYMPGHEQEKKQFYKQEPELWKIYRRLSETRDGSRSTSRTPTQCGYYPPTVTIPDKGGMKCMCYENLMKIIKDKACIPPPMVYRCPNGRPTQQRLDSIFPSWTRKAMAGFHGNKELQYPLATIVVRWQLKRRIPHYDMATLRSLFQRFGQLVDVRIISPNSCLVIFEDIKVACHVVQSRYLGDPMNKLHCTWWHKTMANKNVYNDKKGGVKVKPDLFLQ